MGVSIPHTFVHASCVPGVQGADESELFREGRKDLGVASVSPDPGPQQEGEGGLVGVTKKTN